MSTRCTISRLNPDNTVDTVYCHHDGYPEGVGATLIECYNIPEKIDAMIALGAMSSLGATPQDSFYYGRDRGEKGVGPKHRTWDEYLAARKECYNYIYLRGDWYIQKDSCDEVELVSDILSKL